MKQTSKDFEKIPSELELAPTIAKQQQKFKKIQKCKIAENSKRKRGLLGTAIHDSDIQHRCKKVWGTCMVDRTKAPQCFFFSKNFPPNCREDFFLLRKIR